MSVVLFKDGEQGVFEIHEMPYLLENGWSTDHDAQREDEPQTEKDAVQNEPQEENEPKEETPEDVRELAKDAGIEGWENKRIKTLKAELNEQQA